MSNHSVICLASSQSQAEIIVDQLRSAGFSSNDISALFADHGTSRDFAHEKHTKAPEGTAAGASTGGIVGGALGWLAGIDQCEIGLAGVTGRNNRLSDWLGNPGTGGKTLRRQNSGRQYPHCRSCRRLGRRSPGEENL